jgi:hypothetical protein
MAGVALLTITTMVSIAGAYAVGQARRKERIAPPPVTPAADERVERMERLLETMAEEIERLGESQRFLVKIMAERQLSGAAEPPKSPPRVITPH